jgi:hypothetical protein
MDHIAGGLVFAGVDAEAARIELDRLATSIGEGGPLFEAAFAATLGRSEYMRRAISFAEIQHLTEQAAGLYSQTGSERRAQSALGFVAVAAGLEGNHELSEEVRRREIDYLRRIGDQSVIVSETAAWANSLTELGRAGEALALVREARETSRPDDIGDQVGLDGAEGFARARLGDGAALACFSRGWARAEGIVMAPMTVVHSFLEAKANLLLGEHDAARRIADELVATVERRGALRVADAVRRDVLDRIGAP